MAFASCSNDVEVEQPNGDPTAIEFGDVSTRVGVNDILEFGVYASVKAADATTNVPLLINEEVSRPDAFTAFDYENTKYWIPNATHNFFAYYPYAVEGGAVSAAEALADNNGFKLTFTTPDDANCDLLTAYNSVSTGNDTSTQGPVAIDFNHALAKVTFKVTPNGSNVNDYFKLKSVRLSNITRNGTLTQTTADATWTLGTAKINFAADYGEGLLLEDDLGIDIKEPVFENLLLIPQNRLNTINLNIEYLYQHSSATAGDLADPTKWQSKSGSLSLPASSSWDMGNEYTYTIALTETNNILIKTVDVDVPSWGEDGTGATIIIK